MLVNLFGIKNGIQVTRVPNNVLFSYQMAKHSVQITWRFKYFNPCYYPIAISQLCCYLFSQTPLMLPILQIPLS